MGPPRWLRVLADWMWGKVTPFSIARKVSEKRLRNSLRSYIARHQPIEDPEEIAVMEEYLFQIFVRPCSTEMALFMQFDSGLHALVPLDHPDVLRDPELPFPVSFIYGDSDWMDSRGSREIVRANKFFSTG